MDVLIPQSWDHQPARQVDDLDIGPADGLPADGMHRLDPIAADHDVTGGAGDPGVKIEQSRPMEEHRHGVNIATDDRAPEPGGTRPPGPRHAG